MRYAASQRVSNTLKYLALAGAAGYLLCYLVVALLRIRYPFELQWMEGATVDHVARILAGKGIYVRPSLAFVPYLYTPLYLYLAAGLAKVTGIGFFPLRLISLLASLGSLALIFLFVSRETHSRSAGLLAAGLFAATYRLCDGWFDIARVDSLFLCLLLAGCYLLRFYPTARAMALGGVLLALAFLTKQIALPIAVPVLAYCLRWRRPQGYLAAGMLVTLVAGSTLVLHLVSGGWYTFYAFSLPRQHQLELGKFASFWLADLLAWLPIACTAAVGYFFLQTNADARRWYALLAVGMIGGAWSARVHSGGYSNTVLPAYAMLAILFGLAAARAAERRPAWVYLACLAQFALLIYNPLRFLPTHADLAAGQRVQALVAAMPGAVYLPFHGFLPTLAGKQSYAHAMAVYDVERGTAQPVKAALDAQIVDALTHRRFSAVILDARPEGHPAKLVEPFWYQRELYANYYPAHVLFPSDADGWPATGIKLRPQVLYLPKPTRR